ncbi:hypothetical protein Prum_046210 [Phytohabitans rumicis]|uniref:Uncharacterized protein n=1 Tax=Phytohabitans rumicis TaxID=1076125 RepID=A0A6V8L8P8_9ACTN|nr:hypothetical protein Prum_046210 [Phytohabitans rumicis]
MAKDRRPKDDLQTMAKSRMAHMPAETAGGRLDETADPGPDGRNADPRRDMPQRRDMPPRRDTPPGRGMAQPSGADSPEEPLTDTPPTTSRADKQRNQPGR